LKRSVVLIVLAFGLAAMISAQGPKRAEGPVPGPDGSAGPKRGERPDPRSAGARNPRAEITPVTVSGDILIVRGSPAVKSGDVTYILNRNFSLFGLVDGLKEGAKVTIEGRARGAPRDDKVMFLVPSKLTFNGKTYENLEPPVVRMGPGRDFPGRDTPGRGGPKPRGNFRHHDSPGRNRR